MDNSFKNQIDPASSILILLPANPLMDEICAGLSLMIASKGKKQASVSCPTQMTVEFSRLIGVDKISTQLGNKNLIVTFPGYPAENIERVSYDVENEQFKLTVIPKTGNAAPTKEQIATSYAGIEADVAVLIGGDKETDFPALKAPELKDIKKIHLGVKLLEGKNEIQMISLATAASSISELVAEKIKEMGWEINSDIATNLLTGIEYGSRYFQVKETNAETFKLMAELLEMGGQRVKKVDPKSYPQGAVPQQPYNQPVQPTQTTVQQPPQQDPTQGVVDQDQQNVEEVAKASGQQVAEQKDKQNIPQSWVEPKVYTGTSLS